ncbi:FAD dependent oxidoreductase [Apiosordaria backusii]|uniref:FAD dependent oxidoreductase n=1 Tax=Apiosordaria backusii TaxID=314023 RepID=A0AA40ENG3_9PEZI|nr:FAD dependent oxidoreductase [Apiosordaria backusii]
MTSSPPQHSSSSSNTNSPSSILIIGSGLFGLTTAYSLSRRHEFANTSITVIDRSDPSSTSTFPSPDAASVDTSRIVRADYADHAYAALCDEAQLQWRQQEKPTDLGAQGRYYETGLVVVGDATTPAPVAAPPVEGDVSESPHKKLTGMDYARKSWENVLSLASHNPVLAERIRELPNVDAIREVLGTGGSSGAWGYINKNSGWTDAGASMAWLVEQVRQTGRVNFVAGTVVSLEHNETTVTGARLSDGRVLTADLVMVAAGAWTGSLVDLEGQAVATGQVLGYLDITEEEQEILGTMPVILNLSSGLFIIPPTNRILKVARHAYGYSNPQSLPIPPLPASPGSTSNPVVSIPRTSLHDPALCIPAEGEADLRAALREMAPLPGLVDRPFTKTRLCWYSDTRTADFLIDYHPYWKNLFVATGDSGHAFKFLPVIGDKITNCILRDCPPEFKEKWAWKEWEGSKVLFTEDGSRGGKPGLILDEELDKAAQILPAV